MRLSKALYFGDFVAAPVAIAVLAVVALSGRSLLSACLWLVAIGAGLVAWTLVEYVIHRWVYHRIPFFEKFHDAHHEEPLSLIGAPSFIGIVAILVLFFLPFLAAGLPFAGGFASGVLVGYCIYMLVHHASHHWELRPGTYLYAARLRHMAHHYHGIEGNYGVITSLWDHVFSTFVRRRRARSG